VVKAPQYLVRQKNEGKRDIGSESHIGGRLNPASPTHVLLVFILDITVKRRNIYVLALCW
jgi:hypothetical protein